MSGGRLLSHGVAFGLACLIAGLGGYVFVRLTRSPESGGTGPAASSTLAAPPREPALARLAVSDARAHSGYDRSRFPTWLDLDGNGCDARADTLIAESTTPAQVDRAGPCAVVAGDWLSRYDGIDVDDPSQLQVDHMVPLADAWRSGAWAWSPARRAAFANDTSHPDALVAVTATSNLSKGDSTPDVWRPPDASSWCWYARSWIEVKVRWDLTVTTPERDALGQMLERC